MSKSIQYQVLAQARLLIQDPEFWAEGEFAVSRTGRTLTVGSPRAVRHCAVSAIVLAARQTVGSKKEGDRIAESIMSAIAPVSGNSRDAQMYIWDINDRHGHAAVLDLFDTALAMY